MTSATLRQIYDRAQVPLSSGTYRAAKQARRLRRVLRDSVKPACIIDMGCGDGSATELAALASPGHRIVALDWSAEAVRQVRARGLTVVRAAAEDSWPIASNTADVVIMSELIEHVIDTDAVLDEAWRVLKPGGSLLLSTPNLAAWYNRALLALGVQPVFSEVSLRGVFGRPGTQVAGHLHMFTRRALSGLLVARGFSSISIEGARYHDVPRLLRPLDFAFCAWPSASSILLVDARKT
jgi:2-polyprenyl-3-methyl-5-hydroxy-6-metoxy-1,4-benzoquinol methylase